jgi:hypothetical protein
VRFCIKYLNIGHNACYRKEIKKRVKFIWEIYYRKFDMTNREAVGIGYIFFSFFWWLGLCELAYTGIPSSICTSTPGGRQTADYIFPSRIHLAWSMLWSLNSRTWHVKSRRPPDCRLPLLARDAASPEYALSRLTRADRNCAHKSNVKKLSIRKCIAEAC